MGKIISKFMICCLGRDEEEEQIKEEIEEIIEEKEENHYSTCNLDYLEYGTTIRYYILNNVHRQY
jgi:hypothetical protein